MAKKKATRKAAAFRSKVATLRKLVSGFDSAAWSKLYAAKPRTAKTKKKRAAALAKVSRTYAKLKPFLQRSHKIIKVRSKKKLAAIAEYANVPKVKGLRAVPVATAFPKKLRVTVDRKGQVTLTRGKRYKEVIYKFPKRPRTQKVKGKFLTAGEHAIKMLEEMLPTMKPGLYVLQSRSQDLIPVTADKDSLLRELRRFVFRYESSAPDFMQYLVGFKCLAHTAETAMKRQRELTDARTEAKRRRVLAGREAAAREARRLGKISKRARATGRR